MVCLTLKLVGSWVELGFSVDMEALDELLSINGPWSQFREGNGTPLQYFCLENPMDGAW